MTTIEMDSCERVMRRFAAVIALCAALVLITAPGHAAAASGFVGVDPFSARCDADASGGNCLTTKDLQRMRHANVKFARCLFPWPNVQPVKGGYHWKSIDAIVGALASRGIRVLPDLVSTPLWVEETYNTPPVDTRKARREWRNFLKAAVARYGPGGRYWTDPDLYPSQYPRGPAKPVHTWQIWNEPNLRTGVQGMPAGDYVRLVRISHRAIPAADPGAKILLGGMPGYVRVRAWVYLNKLYEHRGFKRSFDSVALHPYAGTKHAIRLQLKRMRRVMRRHHDARSHLWITELGWGSKRPDQTTPINKGLRGQKRMLKRTFPYLQHHHRRWRLSHVFWFRWRDPAPGTPGCKFCSSSGLFRHSQKPKPVWRAFKRVTAARR